MSDSYDINDMLIAVDIFAHAMKSKLRRKSDQGYSGGLEQDARVNVATLFAAHVQKGGLFCEGQEIDIANLAMMLWWQRKDTLLRDIANELKTLDGERA